MNKKDCLTAVLSFCQKIGFQSVKNRRADTRVRSAVLFCLICGRLNQSAYRFYASITVKRSVVTQTGSCDSLRAPASTFWIVRASLAVTPSLLPETSALAS